MRYVIEWNIISSTEIEADSPEEANEKFERLSLQDLVSDGPAVEVLSEPYTQEELTAKTG